MAEKDEEQPTGVQYKIADQAIKKVDELMNIDKVVFPSNKKLKELSRMIKVSINGKNNCWERDSAKISLVNDERNEAELNFLQQRMTQGESYSPQ
jgi:hypothetical protein